MNFATPVMAGAGGAGAVGGVPGRSGVRLAPDVNRILYVRNLPYKMTGEDLYEVFGQFGTIRQIRTSNKPETKGTAFVVFDDIFDAKTAVENLTGFNVLGRHLVVQYYHKDKAIRRKETREREDERQRVTSKYTTPMKPEGM
eukprot:Rhum_TRINITY_DN23536_c0_g1::Rhum_TRINITY_DN23536_c0_g1_i1::g.178164::m.178164/K12833/SF3B14; pre-mRNA branch site protein p14